jgi:hypothetical protein
LIHRGQTYARSNERMLLSVVRTYDEGPSDVRSINSTLDVRGTIRHTLLFVYPLGNTWTYETPFGQMCIDHRTYARVAGRPLLYQGVGGGFSL